MDRATTTGLYFGLTSGVITTLGLMVGLHSGTESVLVVVGGVITIAIADSMADALGIHIAKEVEKESSKKSVWTATIATLITKMLVALSFLVPVFFFELTTAILIGVVWGLSILTVLSVRIAMVQEEPVHHVVFEHLSIACLVILVTHYVGDYVAHFFQGT